MTLGKGLVFRDLIGGKHRIRIASAKTVIMERIGDLPDFVQREYPVSPEDLHRNIKTADWKLCVE